MIRLICSNGPVFTWGGAKTLSGAHRDTLPSLTSSVMQEIWFEETGRTLGRSRPSLPALFSTFSTICNLARLRLVWQHVEREECEARTEPRVDLGVIRVLSEPLSVWSVFRTVRPRLWHAVNCCCVTSLEFQRIFTVFQDVVNWHLIQFEIDDIYLSSPDLLQPGIQKAILIFLTHWH